MQEETREMTEPNLPMQVKKLRVQRLNDCPNIMEVRRKLGLLLEVIRINYIR